MVKRYRPWGHWLYRACVRLTASEIASIVGGVLVGADRSVNGASIDSRTIQPGQLFVPVRDVRDGHDFAGDALARGSAVQLSERGAAMSEDLTLIRVDDARVALRLLGSAARARLGGTVVGVTGSVGKTTVKDLILGVIRTERRAHGSELSFNNELGVPLTVINAPDDSEVVVVEMGARGLGHVRELCMLADPAVGVVTSVVEAHTAQFGSLTQIAEAKGELVEHLPPDGTAILNSDDPLVAKMKGRTAADVLTFGLRGEVGALRVRLDDDLRATFVLKSPWGDEEVRLGVRGEHQVVNALGAAAVGLSLGVSLAAVTAGLSAAEPGRWRMELAVGAGGVRVLNDSYNANPTSAAAALRALAALPARRRFAVLGTMAELGDISLRAHREVADLARSLGVNLISVAAPDYGVEDFPDIDAARAGLGELGEGDAVLVKGSRIAGLERLASALVEGV